VSSSVHFYLENKKQASTFIWRMNYFIIFQVHILQSQVSLLGQWDKALSKRSFTYRVVNKLPYT